MRTDYLNERLKSITAKLPKQEDNTKTYTPLLIDIERSHTTFLSSYYKPYIPSASEYIKSPSKGGGSVNFGSTLEFALPYMGDFISDCYVHIKISALQATSSLDKVRWTAMLGHRLFKKVEFLVDNIPICEYDSDIMNWYYDNKVPVDKKNNWLKSIGHEIPELGYLVPDPAYNEFREYKSYGMGYQTFKRTQDEVELFMPILFWYRDIKQAIPSSKIPFGKCTIRITLASINELVSYATYGGTGAYVVPNIKIADLYSNNIYVSPDMHDIFAKYAGESVIRVFKKQVVELTNPVSKQLIYSIKHPVESMHVAFRPKTNIDNSQTWNKYTKLTQVNIQSAIVSVSPANTIGITNAVVYKEAQVVSKLEMISQGVSLYKMTPSGFYNIVTAGLGSTPPTPVGWYRFNFSRNPDSAQPTGYLNISSTKETYISYEAPTSNISSSSPVEMIIIAECLNTIKYSDFTAVVAYI